MGLRTEVVVGQRFAHMQVLREVEPSECYHRRFDVLLTCCQRVREGQRLGNLKKAAERDSGGCRRCTPRRFYSGHDPLKEKKPRRQRRARKGRDGKEIFPIMVAHTNNETRISSVAEFRAALSPVASMISGRCGMAEVGYGREW